MTRPAGLEHWEKYYRGGALASCPLGRDSGYTLELREIWIEFFSRQPDGARILDIGTGNGVIPLLAREAAAGACRQFEIHGIDLAQIDPVRDVPDGARLFAGIRFHAGVAAEQLPFDASSFDAVSGQYALEYTEIGRTLAEIRRVLKPGAGALFVLHHADSIVTRKAHQTLEQSALILDDTKILRKLRRHLGAEARSRMRARTTQSDLTADLQRLIQSARQSDNPMLLNVTIDALRQLLAARQRMSAAQLEREIDRLDVGIRASARRLQDLVQCGQTEAGMQQLASLAQAQGLEVRELAPQHHGGNQLVGWRLRLGRT